MKNFFVITNNSKQDALNTRNEIMEYIKSHGGVCVTDDSDGHRGAENLPGDSDGHTRLENLPADTECIIVLGGDGTMLRASIDLADSNVPFIGINIGNLGFLTAALKADAFKAIDKLLKDDYIIEDRMMIFGQVESKGKIINDRRALNEIVLTGDRFMQVVYLSVYINDRLVTKYQADGIIVSTPTGSSGYNLSAGGPIVNPTARNLILTPVSPHSMRNRSIIFSAEDAIKIEVDLDRYGKNQQLVAVYDGANSTPLNSGDSVTIRKSEKATRIIKVSHESFIETLHNKLKDD